MYSYRSIKALYAIIIIISIVFLAINIMFSGHLLAWSIGTQTSNMLHWVRLFSIFSIITIAMYIAALTIDKKLSTIPTLDNSLKQLLQRLTKLSFLLAGVFVILPSFGIDITALSVIGGAIGVGIGFGLQKIASNYLSGFIILLDKSIKIGDWVMIEGINGLITKITIRYVVLQGFDGSEMIIPNEKFISDTVINKTYSNTDVAVESVLTVGYEVSLPFVLDVIYQCVITIPEINSNKAPDIYIQKLHHKSADIFIRSWPNNALVNINIVRNKLHLNIIEHFARHNINISSTQFEVKIINKNLLPDAAAVTHTI